MNAKARFHLVIMAALPILAGFITVGCGGNEPEQTDIVTMTSGAIVARSVGAPFGGGTASVAAGIQLSYGGGPVLANVEVVSVFWGFNVNSTVTSTMGGFYTAMTDNVYMDHLAEFDTPTQIIGRGSLRAFTAITPGNTSTALTDAAVNTELAAQIQAGHLPAPNANTLYAIHFPPGTTIDGTALRIGNSCKAGGFCGYHSAATKTISGRATSLRYTVMPDFGPGSGCDVGCGSDSMIDNFTSTASHEVVEAVTDPEPFAGWSNPNAGEIGDLCNHHHGTITTVSGTQYTVQKEWSNAKGACIVTGDEFFLLAVPGCANAIGVGPGSSAWALGCASGGAGGKQIFRLTSTGWVQVPGAATNIAVAPEGAPWVVDASGNIFKWNGSAFQQLGVPGCATGIGVGRSDQAWVLGCTSGGGGGNQIFRLTPTGWAQVPGAATHIWVSPEGTPWVGNASGTIFKWNGSSFQPLSVPGCATSIAVGPRGEGWAIGCTSGGPGGGQIFHLTSTGWVQVPGAAVQVAVSPEGTPWVVSSIGNIFN